MFSVSALLAEAGGSFDKSTLTTPDLLLGGIGIAIVGMLAGVALSSAVLVSIGGLVGVALLSVALFVAGPTGPIYGRIPDTTHAHQLDE